MASITTLLQRARRLFINRCVDARDIRAQLSTEALDRLTARVAASEQHHSGELRICIEAGLPWSYICRDATPRDRALTLFGKLRVWDTEHNNGVLIYLLLAERAIELIADRGINARVSTKQWSDLATKLGNTLTERPLEDGLNEAVDALSDLLAAYFPADGVRKVNELPDRPVVLS